MIDNILRKIFIYVFGKYIKEQELKFIRNFEKQTKLLESEIKSYFADYLDTNKYKVKQLISKESIEKGVSEVAEKEINSRGLACAVDFGTRGDDTQIILIGNNKGKHFVKSFNIRCENVIWLGEQLNRFLNKNELRVDRTYFDSMLGKDNLIGIGGIYNKIF